MYQISITLLKAFREAKRDCYVITLTTPTVNALGHLHNHLQKKDWL